MAITLHRGQIVEERPLQGRVQIELGFARRWSAALPRLRPVTGRLTQ